MNITQQRLVIKAETTHTKQQVDDLKIILRNYPGEFSVVIWFTEREPGNQLLLLGDEYRVSAPEPALFIELELCGFDGRWFAGMGFDS